MEVLNDKGRQEEMLITQESVKSPQNMSKGSKYVTSYNTDSKSPEAGCLNGTIMTSTSLVHHAPQLKSTQERNYQADNSLSPRRSQSVENINQDKVQTIQVNKDQQQPQPKSPSNDKVQKL